MNKEEVAGTIDHTLLGAEVTKAEVKKKCQEAKEYNFASVCTNPDQVALVKKELAGSEVKVCTVIGFPLGVNLTEIKVKEAEAALKEGADEIDMVMKIGALKEGDYDKVEKDIKAVVKAAQTKIVKVIIETCYLTEAEKIKACEIAKKAGADFVKTSTGFGNGGATVEDIVLMRKTVGQKMGVKASGGVHNLKEAEMMLDAGATRIGASSGVEIIEGKEAETNY